MGSINNSNKELASYITGIVLKELNLNELEVTLGVSNRHIHLCQADLDVLFGQNASLTKLKDLKQPGQYASEQLVTIKGPKGSIQKVRVLGPLRKDTQIEISATDSFSLGVKPPCRDSGKLENTPGLEIIGPAGIVQKSEGTIIAKRHIHMDPKTAESVGLNNGDLVKVELPGERGMILTNVLIRVSSSYALEMHIDTDEANASGAKNNQMVKIVR